MHQNVLVEKCAGRFASVRLLLKAMLSQWSPQIWGLVKVIVAWSLAHVQRGVVDQAADCAAQGLTKDCCYRCWP